MTVYLWAFLSSRLPVLHHQAFCAYRVTDITVLIKLLCCLFQLCISKVTKRKVSSISLIHLGFFVGCCWGFF